MKKFITKDGVAFFVPTLEELEDADNDSAGFCLACGEIEDGVEPDATKYQCSSCGEYKVYGAAEFALRGWVV